MVDIATVAKTIASLSGPNLQEMFEALALEFSKRAEAIYDEDPENNGLEAQPFARIADACDTAAKSFYSTEEVSELEASVPETSAKVINPWGRR
jgi:hypothetical protein